MGEWISVENELPKKEGNYYTKKLCGSIEPFIREEYAPFYQGKFHNKDFSTVRYWMLNKPKQPNHPTVGKKE